VERLAGRTLLKTHRRRGCKCPILVTSKHLGPPPFRSDFFGADRPRGSRPCLLPANLSLRSPSSSYSKTKSKFSREVILTRTDPETIFHRRGNPPGRCVLTQKIPHRPSDGSALCKFGGRGVRISSRLLDIVKLAEIMRRNEANSTARDLAQWLIAYEASLDRTPQDDISGTCRVCEKLRRSLGSLVGPEAYRTLTMRALTLAKREAPLLTGVQVENDGSISGLIGEAINSNHILIGHLISLMERFIGTTVTLWLIRDIWTDLPNFEIERLGVSGINQVDQTKAKHQRPRPADD